MAKEVSPCNTARNAPACIPPGTSECPACALPTRPAGPGDPVLLLQADAFHDPFITPLLEDSGIPFSRQGSLGAAFTMYGGSLLETYAYFVPYAAWDQAAALLRSALGNDPAILDQLTIDNG